MGFLPHIFENRPTGSTDAKYKADATEVMANLNAILNAIAFYKQEVDVSAASSDRNFSTSNDEYGASISSQCNLTHLLGDLFKGKIESTVAAGDKLGIMDTTGRYWVVTLANDDQISFGESSGGSSNKCLWERLDGGGAFSSYNSESWMNTLSIWTIRRCTDTSNIFEFVTKDRILLGTASDSQLDAADIPINDAGTYFATDFVENALQDCGAHLGDSSDPHGATLTQTNLTVSGTTSLAVTDITGNFSINTNKLTVAASTGNTVIAGTLQVDGAIAFNANLTISSTYTLTIGSGGMSATGDIVTTTKVKTPEIRNDGDVTIDAYNASAHSDIYLKNSDGTYESWVHLDGRLIFDKGNAQLLNPLANYVTLIGNTDVGSFYFNITDSTADAWIYVKTGIKFGDGPITLYKVSDVDLEFDIKRIEGDTTLWIKNTGAGNKANVDISGNLNVQGTVTADVSEVVTARGSYGNLDARITAIAGDGGTPGTFTPAQTKIVAKSGGDYTTIQAAITAITDATASKPYVVMIYPGIYNEIITMKTYVYLVGVDRNACIINATTDDNMIKIDFAGKTGLFNLYLKGYTDKGCVYLNNSSAELALNQCVIEPQGATSGYGVHVPSTYNPTINILNCLIKGSAGYGIYNSGSPEINLQNTKIYLEGTSSHEGIYSLGGYLNVLGCHIRTYRRAIYVQNETVLCDSRVQSIGGTNPVLTIHPATINTVFWINNCLLRGNSGVSVTDTGKISFRNSVLEATGNDKSALDTLVDDVNLLNCVLKAGPEVGTSYSIYSSNSILVNMCNCTLSRTVHSNVTIGGGSIYGTTNALNTNIE